MMYRWSVSKIKKFLELYRPYECLYNTKHKDYKRKAVRREYLEKLLKQVQEEIPGAEKMTITQLEKKKKSLKDTFRVEMIKVEKSRRASITGDKIYCPKLEWFDNARFLLPYTMSRQVDNLELEVNIVDSMSFNDGNITDGDRNREEEDVTFESLESYSEAPFPHHIVESTFTTNASTSDSLSRKRKNSEKADDAYAIPMKKLSTSENELKPCKNVNDVFGEYIAEELKRLQPIQQIILRQKLVNAMTAFCINGMARDNSNIQIDEFENELEYISK